MVNRVKCFIAALAFFAAVVSSIPIVGMASTSTPIKQFIQVESRATGFSSDDIAAQLIRLTSAGNDLHDAELIEGVAEEWALGTDMSLEQTTRILIEAGKGNVGALANLEPSLNITAKSKMSDVLRQLHKKYPLTIKE
jgi:hypothetical protein